jgi:hypothetical protein
MFSFSFLTKIFKRRTYESEYDRGHLYTENFIATKTPEECIKETDTIQCDYDMSHGIMKGFPNGALDTMKSHGYYREL